VADRFTTPGSVPHLVLAVSLWLLTGLVAIAATLILIGFVVIHVGALDRWDERVNVWFVHRRTSMWTTISAWGTFIANTLGIVVVAAIVSVVLVVRRIGRMAALLACGLMVELIAFLTTTYTVGRPRPAVPHLGSTPSTNSFPSGHAAATFVLYVGIALLVHQRTRNVLARTLALIVAATFPLWVAFSRVYRGQHHPTDVLAGLALGAAALTLAFVALQRAGTTVHDQGDDT